MQLKGVLAAKKTIVSWGTWEHGKKMPRNAFPMSKSRSYRVPSTWTGWRVVIFEALGEQFRLLVAFDTGKEEYRAWLGQVKGDDTLMLARLEYHGSHPGWHCHTNCEHSNSLTAGRVVGFGDRRLPKARNFHRDKKFDITEANALGRAIGFFGLWDADDAKGELI